MLLLLLAFALLFHPNDGSSLVHNVHKNLLLPTNVGALGSHIAFNNSLQLAFRSHIGFSCYGSHVHNTFMMHYGGGVEILLYANFVLTSRTVSRIACVCTCVPRRVCLFLVIAS